MELPRYDINKYDPKQMVVVPLLIFIIAATIIGFTFANTGAPVILGIDFAGGTAVTIHTIDTGEQIRAFYTGYPLTSIDEGIGNAGYCIKFGPMSNEEMVKFNEKTLTKYPDASIDQIGANFGTTLQSQALTSLFFAFVGMMIIVFVAFRKLIPAIAVVFAGIADIIVATGIMNVLGIELSLATTAALLMLIGYSVDSNILLTSKVIKHQGKLTNKMTGAFHTGFIMTTTTLAATIAMLIVAIIGQVPTLYDIAAVLVIGLICDMIFTWVFNAGVLQIYMREGESKKRSANTKQKIKGEKS
jgi:preprotein translocase subunit SecF